MVQFAMVQDDFRFESSDGTKLFVRRWMPELLSDAKLLAVVYIAHGMAENAGRYGRLAERLCKAGIEVWSADQRGHGKTAGFSGNDPGKGGLLGHCSDKDTFSTVAADVGDLIKEIRKVRPGVPVFLLGHSWGSFITQYFIEGWIEGSPPIDGCILSGTRGPGGLQVKAGVPLMTLVAFFKGQRKGSPFARSVADGPYNKPFRPNRTPSDWLSRDEAEVDAFIADPCNGQLCSSGFYRDLARGLYRIHRPEAMARIRRDLPIYIFCGSADPVGAMGASPTALVNAYRSLGIKDLEFVLYPDARHEPLNETNREEVMENLLSWICRHLPSTETNKG